MFTGKRKVYKPLSYHKDAIKNLVSNPAYGLFMRPGLGKTGCYLAAFKILKDKGYVDHMLVVSTKRVIQLVWPQEVKKWEQFSKYSYGLLHGSKKDKTVNEEYDIYAVTFEGVSWLRDLRKLKKKISQSPLLNSERVMLVVDESSKIKNSRSSRFKNLRKIMNWFVRRYIGTGSPRPNSMMDIWSQVFVLDTGKALGQYITQFKHEYFHPSGYGGYDWKLQKGAERDIFKKLEGLVSYYGDELLPDLPDLVEVDHRVQLDAKAYRVYKELEDDYIAEVNESTVTAVNAVAKYSKLHQIANGNVYDEQHSIISIHKEKIIALQDIIEELSGSPCLIGYHFTHDKKLIQDNLPDIEFFDSKNEAAILARWEAGEITSLAGNIRSIAHGLNLQDAGYNVVFFSLTNVFEDCEQFIRRLRRSGQLSKNVFVHYLIAEGTVDEDILASTKRKDVSQLSLLKAMKKRKGGTMGKLEILQQVLGPPTYMEDSQPHVHQFINGLLLRLHDLGEQGSRGLYKDLFGGESILRYDKLYATLKKEILSLFEAKEKRNMYTMPDDGLAEIYLETTLTDYYGPYKGVTMNEETEDAKKPAKKKAAKKPIKADPKKVAKKKAKTQKANSKAQKKEAKKATPKGAAAKKKVSKKAATNKPSMTGKIKALENTAREGTVRHKLMGVIMKCKTVEEAIGRVYKYDGKERKVASIDIKVAQNIGCIIIK